MKFTLVCYLMDHGCKAWGRGGGEIPESPLITGLHALVCVLHVNNIFSLSDPSLYVRVHPTFSPILRSESNVKPIWLTQVACTSSDLTLFHCTRGTNIIGYANCSAANIAAVDCGKFCMIIILCQIVKSECIWHSHDS